MRTDPPGHSLLPGNAYCFLALFRATSNPKHLHRAVQFALAYLDPTYFSQMRTPDACDQLHSHVLSHLSSISPFSLYEGSSGMICLLSDLLHDPHQAAFPLFEDIF